MKEFPANKVHLQPAIWLTGKFSSRRMSRPYWPVWVWSQGKIDPFSWRGGGGRGFWQQHVAAILDSYSQQHFHSKDILFFPNLSASKNLPEEQIFWGTDPLGAPVCSQETSRHPRANNTIFHNFLAVPAEQQHWVERRVHIRHSEYV